MGFKDESTMNKYEEVIVGDMNAWDALKMGFEKKLITNMKELLGVYVRFFKTCKGNWYSVMCLWCCVRLLTRFVPTIVSHLGSLS